MTKKNDKTTASEPTPPDERQTLSLTMLALQHRIAAVSDAEASLETLKDNYKLQLKQTQAQVAALDAN